VEISLRNLQRQPISEAPLIEVAREAAALLPTGEGLETLTIVLTDDARIAELNEAFLGRAEVTDVIAFEAEEGAGELFVSVTTAARQAPEQGHDLSRELAFLVAHGVLHVLGMDDTEPAARQAMLDLQSEALGRMERASGPGSR
jgi:probable rRNA maturation factor